MVSLALLLNHDEPDVNRSHLLWLVCSAAAIGGCLVPKSKQVTTTEALRFTSSASIRKKETKNACNYVDA